MQFMREVDSVGARRYPLRVRLSWGARVSDAFVDALFALGARFGWTFDHLCWLMACIAFETGRTFDPRQKNLAGSGAIGLIQFMPRTAIGLGTTTAALASMSAVEQLAYVEAYFLPYHTRISSLPDMYLAILMPAYVGRPGASVLFSGATTAYRQNAGLDTNSDGRVTKDEASQRVHALLIEGQQPVNARDVWHEEVA